MIMKEKAKRAVDVLFSIIALVISLPIICLISILIYLTMGRPIFFKQVRPGLYGKPFVLYKFRTMLDLRDQTGKMLPDERRLTSFGRWLRSTSLDELPVLFNVLKGDMSLVGPRPLLMEYLDRYTPEQARRHEVKPGITGWAQINGRNAISWEEKFDLDVWYVDNWSLFLDLKIVILTIIKVLKREGISPEFSEIMPKFGEKI